MDLVIAEPRTEWNGYFEAALRIQVRVGCTFLTSVGLREGVGIVTGLSWVSSTFNFICKVADGWCRLRWDDQYLTDWSQCLYIATFSTGFCVCFFILIQKMAPHITFCLFVKHKLKMILFGHAVLFFLWTHFIQTFQIVRCNQKPVLPVHNLDIAIPYQLGSILQSTGLSWQP